ncbi:hypothetical protein POKO110462_03895 [Pontibacter korlensis]
MGIVLANNVFQGNVVRQHLNKTLGGLTGPDSEYSKASIRKFLDEMPEGEGFVALFNGKDLTSWKGLVANPIERAKMDKNTLAQKQKQADEQMRQSWVVEKGNSFLQAKAITSPL